MLFNFIKYDLGKMYCYTLKLQNCHQSFLVTARQKIPLNDAKIDDRLIFQMFLSLNFALRDNNVGII